MKRRRVEEGSGRLDQATVMSFFQPKKKIKQQQQQKNAHAEEMSTKKIEAKQEKAKDMAMGDSEMIQIEPTSPIANAAKIEQQAEARPELTDIDADIDEASDNGLELKHLEGISAIKATDTEMGPLLPTIDGSSSKIPAQLSQRSDSAKNPSSLARTGVLMRQQSTFQDTLEALEGSDSATAGTKQQTEILWNRQPVPPEIAQKSNSHPLIFQQMKIDEYQDSVTGKLQARLYGITEQGNSVTCFVEGFYPYFYVPSPPGFDTARIEEVVRNINRAVEGAERSRGEANAVRRIDIVLKESIYGYHGGVKSKFWRIEVKYPYLISVVKGVLERRGVAVPGVPGEYRVEQVYESSLEYTLRFMIDHNIVGANWIELPAGKYRYRERAATRAQIEVEVDHRDIVSYEPLNEWAKVAPLRILSFDIECAGRKGVFPEANVDPVIQIANMVTIHGEAKPFIRNIFTLNTCASIVGSQILSYDREEDLLLAWGDFITKVDPDIIIGYNISNFDLPYLLDRASALKVDRFAYLLGRVKDVKSVVKDSRFSSKAYGTRDNKVVNMDGRVQFDVLQAMRRDYGLRSFSLNAVSAQFLGEQKEDVPHSIITELQNGNEETRRRLAVYCLKDAYLPQRLVDKLMLLVNYMEMARVTGVPFNYLLARGQQIKVVSQLYRKAIQQDLIIPTIEQRGGAGSGEDQYEGATVIEPKRGFYDVPIATLDFASLYPSIMMAHNLCYTTLLNERVIKELGLVKDKDYEVTPTGDAFVRAEVHKGLLPEVLRELLSARKKAKTDMKKELDPFKVKVLNGRQLALKISANSV
ncbi:DNA-directed DNA polymerase delta, partial [Spiromyces aspiralis]